jgi:peroxiredoxin
VLFVIDGHGTIKHVKLGYGTKEGLSDVVAALKEVQR